MQPREPWSYSKWFFQGVFLLFSMSSFAQEVKDVPKKIWSVSAGCTEYFAAPVQILDIHGSSPSFVPKWQKGWGMDFSLGRALGKHGTLLARGIWDRVPLGYATDVEPTEHPGLGISYSIESLNSTYWSRRLSLGLSYKYGWKLSRNGVIDLGIGILRNLNTNNYAYRVGEGALTDSSVIWILGLDTQVFPGASPWHGRAEIQFTRRVYKDHALFMAYYVDIPFSDVYTNGRATLLGNSEYRTTLTFRQSGFIQGLTVGYTYGWSRNLKRAAERGRKR